MKLDTQNSIDAAISLPSYTLQQASPPGCNGTVGLESRRIAGNLRQHTNHSKSNLSADQLLYRM